MLECIQHYFSPHPYGIKLTRAHSILDRRRAGVLLHITSLPGGVGNGDLGQEAYHFVDFLSQAGITVWQTLPTGPTHEDGSPYQCMSAHAGNPLLANLQWLVDKGWLASLPRRQQIDTPQAYRRNCLHLAFTAFKSEAGDLQSAFLEFTQSHASWLDDFALYMAIREDLEGECWNKWPIPLRDRHPESLEATRLKLQKTINFIKFEQFVFFEQWRELRAYAKSKDVMMFGDMPIFVAYDSADVWACRGFFDLTDDGLPRVVAGVPPDYFSAVGQRWGNPHYDWVKMENDGFSWWSSRLRSQMELYDWVRIDHFRGFEAYWEIPADQDTAVHGRWVEAPGEVLLDKLFESFPGIGLPLVAENLGVITPEVEALRNRYSIPGMLILQFAFDGGPDNPYLPHNHDENNVVYTGTHDNDTTLSWFQGLTKEQRRHVLDYLGCPSISMPMALMQCALASVAKLAILPMQDILELNGDHRMNTPGTVGPRNWRWRFGWHQVNKEKVARLANLVRLYGRALGCL